MWNVYRGIQFTTLSNVVCYNIIVSQQVRFGKGGI